MKSFTLALSVLAVLGLSACSHGTCNGTAYAGTACNLEKKGEPMKTKKHKADAAMSKALRK